MRTNEVLAMPSKWSNCLQARLQTVKAYSPFHEKQRALRLRPVC